MLPLLLLAMTSLRVAAASSVDGVWRSEGSALVFEIRGTELRSFEITETTCVPALSAKRLATAASGDAVSFRSRQGGTLFSVVPGGDHQHAQMKRRGALTVVMLTKISALPKVCSPPTTNSPLGNFDVFAETFLENYISFDLRHVDWRRVTAEHRADVNAQTTPAQLFEILASMIKPLRDIHTGIEAPQIKRAFDAPLRPGSDRVVHGNIERFAKAGRRQLAGVTDRAYLSNRLSSFCRGQWQYGRVREGVCYLRILGFGDYSRRNGREHDVDALNRALDRILADPALRGLVIDLRLSFGGDDRLGLAIAARLTARPYLAYAIQARADAASDHRFTDAQQVFVQPGRRPVFTGPVVALTGPITMSAAETFLQALIGRQPYITRIGENTQGVFCDSLERRLPNGWIFELPNAVYRTSEGRAFDVFGLPPDVPVPVFADNDVASGRDPAMATALHLLNRGK